jgi:hypothetical protein
MDSYEEDSRVCLSPNTLAVTQAFGYLLQIRNTTDCVYAKKMYDIMVGTFPEEIIRQARERLNTNYLDLSESPNHCIDIEAIENDAIVSAPPSPVAPHSTPNTGRKLQLPEGDDKDLEVSMYYAIAEFALTKLSPEVRKELEDDVLFREHILLSIACGLRRSSSFSKMTGKLAQVVLDNSKK